MIDTKATPAPERATWNEQKAKLREKFPELTNADLDYQDGEKEAMLSKVQVKLDKTKEELAAIILEL